MTAWIQEYISSHAPMFINHGLKIFGALMGFNLALENTIPL